MTSVSFSLQCQAFIFFHEKKRNYGLQYKLCYFLLYSSLRLTKEWMLRQSFTYFQAMNMSVHYFPAYLRAMRYFTWTQPTPVLLCSIRKLRITWANTGWLSFTTKEALRTFSTRWRYHFYIEISRSYWDKQRFAPYSTEDDFKVWSLQPADIFALCSCFYLRVVFRCEKFYPCLMRTHLWTILP